MHFVLSLLFLLAIMALTLAYIAVAYFFVRIILQAIRQLIGKIRKKPGTPGAWKAVFIPKISRRLLIFLGAFFLGYHVLLYAGQREKWMGPENAHLEAKEYWVAGQVLYGTRLMLSRFFYPDYPLLYPLNQLQRAIYNRGVRYLPDNDGEIGVWMNI